MTDKSLDQLAPEEDDRTVTVGDMKIVVTEVTMKHLQGFTRACGPFLSAFEDKGELANKVVDGQEVPPDEFALLKLISDHADAMMDAAALVTNAPKLVYERMRPDDFFRVAAKVLEVNGAFFVRRLAPQLIRFALAMSQIGMTMYNTSSQQATPTQE